MLNPAALIRPLGILCVLISLATWSVDLLGMVEICWYCRLQRTIIGVLGLILIYRQRHFILEYLALLIGAFGLYLASRQFMDNFLQSLYHSPNIYLSAGSLMLQVAALYLYFFWLKPRGLAGSE